jgi:hypothetical protein
MGKNCLKSVDGVGFIVLSAVSCREEPDSGGEFGRDVEDGDAVLAHPNGQGRPE